MQTFRFGSKRSLNAEISLVPFIDVFSMCILFLLFSAVWVQIGSIDVKQGYGTEGVGSTAEFEMDVAFVDTNLVRLTLQKNGKLFRSVPVAFRDATEMDAKVLSAITGLSTSLKHPALRFGEKVRAARVYAHPKVPYGELVRLMDLLRNHQLVNLGIVPFVAPGGKG